MRALSPVWHQASGLRPAPESAPTDTVTGDDSTSCLSGIRPATRAQTPAASDRDSGLRPGRGLLLMASCAAQDAIARRGDARLRNADGADGVLRRLA